MKRIAFIIYMGILAFMLAACGNASDTVNEGTVLQLQNTDALKADVQMSEPEKQTNATNVQEGSTTQTTDVKEENEAMQTKMNITVGDYSFTATLEDNAAVNELVEMMKEKPVVLNLDDYSGFEKVGSLGKSLTRSDKQTTTKSGDIVLYNGDNVVMFYGSNSWSYTRLGKIDDLTDWEKALGSGSVTVTFSLTK